jgi:hypothetical protein
LAGEGLLFVHIDFSDADLGHRTRQPVRPGPGQSSYTARTILPKNPPARA